MLDDSIVMVKPTEYQHFHEIINVDDKTSDWRSDGKSNEILRIS